jgi:predicted DNA-binding protein
VSAKKGRPKSETPKEVRYSIRLDEPTEMSLQEYCVKTNITKAEAIRRGIELLLKKE